MHENEDSFAYSFQFVFFMVRCFHRLQILRYVSMVTEKSIAELYRT